MDSNSRQEIDRLAALGLHVPFSCLLTTFTTLCDCRGICSSRAWAGGL